LRGRQLNERVRRLRAAGATARGTEQHHCRRMLGMFLENLKRFQRGGHRIGIQ
jgi:hypothetical protein